MNRTLKSLLGAAVLVAFVAPVAMAQTGSLQGQRTIFNDGGTTVGTFNRIYLQTPADATLVADYSLILPPNDGNANDILFTPDGNGTLEFNSGDGLFWKLIGNNTTFTDGVNNLLGPITADPLNIITNNTTRIRVLSTGQVGIGTSTPGFLLDVAGDANVQGFSYLRKNAYFYDAVNGYLGGNITAVEPGGASGDATKLGIYGGRNTGGIILYTNVNNAQTEVMRLTSDPNAAIGGRVSIKAGSAPNALVSVGGGAGGNLTIDDNGNLVTAGNITINGTGTNTIGVAASTNNITGTNTLLGATSINTTAAFNTSIGNTTGGNVTIGVNDGTTNLTLNGITDVAPSGADDILWITDVTNQVRRTSFGGLVEQGLTFDAESGSTKIRLGGLSTISNPFAADRYVNLDVYDLTFTAAGGTRTLLDLNGDATDGNFQLNSFGTGEGFITSNRKTFILNNGAGLPALFVANTDNTQNSWLEIGDQVGTGRLAIGVNNPGGANFIDNSTGRNLEIRTSNVVEATFSSTGLNIVNNLTVGDNATIGNADADQHLIRGVTDINTTAANAATTIGATTNTGAVAVASGTTITTNSLGLTSVTAGTGVDVTATTGDIDVTSSAGEVNITAVGAGNDVNISATDDVDVFADSDFNVNAKDDIDLIVESNVGATTANIVMSATNTVTATNADISMTSGGSISSTSGTTTTQTVGTTYSLSAPTANINTATASTTNIGNNTNGVTNIYGAGASGLTLTGNMVGGPAGTNTIVIDPGEVGPNPGDEYDLILNNIKEEDPIEDLLWLTSNNEVRKTDFLGTANEGLQFQNSAYRLGVGFSTDNVSPWDEKSFLEDRYVNLNRSTLFFTTNNSARALLELNGDEYSGSTHLFSYGMGNITLDADSNDVILSANGALGMVQLNATDGAGDIDINAGDQLTMDASDVTVTATDDLIATVSDLMDVNVGDLDLDATATITQTSAGNSVYEATGGSLTIRTTGAAPGTNDVLITSNDEIYMSAPVATTVEASGTNGVLWLQANGTNGSVRMLGTSTIRQWSPNLNLNFDYATASTTRIGNNTNAVVNIAGFNNNGVTITGAQNASGDNTIVIDPGALTSNLRLANIAQTTAPVNMLSLDGAPAGGVRVKALTGMADEGLQYDGTDGEFKLGHATDGSNPITSARFVRLSGTGDLTFNTSSNTMLSMDGATGNVNISTTGNATTNIGSSNAGAVNIGGAGVDITAHGSTDIELLAAGDFIRADAAIIDIDATTRLDLNTGVNAPINAGRNGNTTNLLSNTIEIGKGAYTTAVNIGTTANTTTTVLGTTNINRAGGSTTQIGANGNTVELLASTNNIGTDAFATTNTIGRTSNATNNILGTTNINNVAGGDNTVIGNTGTGTTTVTINAGTTGNIVLGGVDTDNTPDYMVSLDASPTGNVRLKQLTSMADEGLQYDGTDGEFKLGSSTAGTGSPITSSRFVNVGSGTLTFRDATNTRLLVLNNNGNVEMNTSSTGTTTIGSSSAGAVAVTANANISLEAVGTGDISFTATGDAVNTNAENISLQGSATVDMDAPAITINDAGSGTTQIGNASAGTILVRSASTITGTAGTTMDLNMADLDVDASASIDLNAGSTYTATGATAATMTATANALTLNANGTSGSVVVNATGAGNDIDINANDDVTIDATDIASTATTSYSVSAPTTNINTATNSTTNIGNTTDGAVNISGNGTNGVTITGSGTTTNSIKIDPGANNNLILDNISSLSPVLDLLWITTNNEVRRAPFTATADEGVQFQSSSYRLGVAASTDADPWNDKSLLQNRYVNLNTSSLFFTTNNANTALLELNGSAANGSVNMFSYGTGNITLQAGSNDVVLNANSATGMVQLNATNAAGDIDINAGDQLTLDAADIVLTATDDITLDAADFLSVEAASATLTTQSGDLTITVPGASSGNDLILNGIDSDNTVLTYLGVTGSNAVREVSLNATAWLLGGNTLTGTQTIGSNSAHDVAIETNGTTRLTFASSGTISQTGNFQVTFSGNVDATNGLDVTNADLTVGGSNFVVDDATGNISNIGTTTFGDGTGTDNSTFNLGPAGLLTINNDNAVNNLIIQETAISRTGNIAINTGGNTINTDGSINATNNLTVNGTAALGDGSGTDNVTISTGSGSLSVTGLTNINTTGANSTNIGSTSNAGIVDIESQSNINLTTAGTGTVSIQGSNNGAVVIGNATTSTITVVGTVGVNTTTTSNTNIGTGTNTGIVTLGNANNDVEMSAPVTFNRSMNVKFNLIGTTTTLDESYHVVVCTNAGGIAVNLPAAATAGAGRVYVIKSAGAGDVVITPNGVETIEGLASFTITGGGNLTRTIVSSGATWYVIGN